MKEIKLIRGQIALVDDEDYELVSKYNWGMQSGGYARAVKYKQGKQITYLMHRLVMGFPDYEIDHKDHNKLNNCRSNLRLSNKATNSMNRRKQRGTYKSKFKGVTLVHKPYLAYITKDNKHISLGTHRTEKDAARAYNKAAIELFGEFACLNEV